MVKRQNIVPGNKMVFQSFLALTYEKPVPHTVVTHACKCLIFKAYSGFWLLSYSHRSLLPKKINRWFKVFARC